MGAQIKRILSLTVTGILVLTQGTVTEASTISASMEKASNTVIEESVTGSLTDSENFVESGIIEEAASDAAPEITDTGPYDTGPGEEEPAEEYEVTTNDEGQTVYSLLSNVSECLKIDMTEGETVYIQGNGYTIQTDDNGIYASGSGTLVISDVTVLGGDNTSGVGVLDCDVNITLSGNVSIQELYFGGNKLSIADNANVILYGRGSQVQSLYYAGKEFSKGENASLILVQTGMDKTFDTGNARYVYLAYGEGIENVWYITDQDTIAAGILLPILATEGNSFNGWYYDSDFENQYDAERTISDGMVIYAKFVDSRGNVAGFTKEQCEEIKSNVDENALIEQKAAGNDNVSGLCVVDQAEAVQPQEENVTPPDENETDISETNEVIDEAQSGGQTPDISASPGDVKMPDPTDGANDIVLTDDTTTVDETETGPPKENEDQYNDDDVGADCAQIDYTEVIEDDTGPGIVIDSEAEEINTGPGDFNSEEQAIMIEDDTGPGINIETDRISEYNTGPGDTT